MDSHKNFAVSVIAGIPSPATSGTTATVAPGDGGNFPAVPFQAIICPAGSQPTLATAEIVRVTAMTGDAITAMTRAQEGTSPRVVTAGDTIHAGPTKRWWDDVETTLSTLAPIANPTFTGQATVPTIAGGAGVSDTLQLKASSAVLPTGTIDMIGNATTTFRHRMLDGHVHIGTDATNAGAPAGTIANAQVMLTARDRTIAWNTIPLAAGTCLMIGASTAEPHRVAANINANGSGVMAVYDVDSGTGGNATQHVSIFATARNYDPNFSGCPAAFQGFGYTYTNTFSGLHADASLPFGMDCKARVANTVTDASHPGLTGLEVGGSDDSLHRATNVGSAIHIVNQGNNNIRNAIVIGSTAPGKFGAYENGIVFAVGTRGLLASGWTSGQAYLGGEVVVSVGIFYLAKTAVTSATAPASDATHWLAGASNATPPTWVTGRDHGIHTVVTDGVNGMWVCAATHTNGTVAPHLDQWNGFNGVAGPDGLASATASAGHWVPYDQALSVANSYTNTGLTSNTVKPGFYFYAGPVSGSNMLGNTPTGSGQTFSVDTNGNVVASGTVTVGGLIVTGTTVGIGSVAIAGNIGFNGKAAQALTGWAAPTGTKTRTTFDPSTATTLTNAQHLAALVTDLIANGVIG